MHLRVSATMYSSVRLSHSSRMFFATRASTECVAGSSSGRRPYQEAFPARYRLYQTATPRVFDASNTKVARLDRTKWIVASMSDASIFGPVAYRLPYKEAVEKRFLSDYRIIALGVDERAWTAANRIVQQFEQSQESRGLTTREALSWLVYGVTLAGGVVGDDGRLRVSRSLAFSTARHGAHSL